MVIFTVQFELFYYRFNLDVIHLTPVPLCMCTQTVLCLFYHIRVKLILCSWFLQLDNILIPAITSHAEFKGQSGAR
jgi:hypothetical protein